MVHATIRHDRNRYGGGILFYSHNSLSHKFIAKSANLEFMLLSVVSNIVLNIVFFFFIATQVPLCRLWMIFMSVYSP